MILTPEMSEKLMFMGKHRALVKKIDDPKQMRRIRVLCPLISETEILPWALPCDSLKQDWLPEIGDVVWIEFEGGEVDKPIWIGLAVAKADVSSEFLGNYGSSYRIDRDYNGNKMEWKDDGMVITDKNGNTVFMNDSKVEFYDASGFGVRVESGQVYLKSGDATAWQPNILKIDPFSGVPHGGPGGGIVKLKGE
jgi:hypothetical protein